MSFRHCRQGFTLIELLVVMAIGALITGMIVTIGPRQGRGQVVQMAAEQVAALLRRARAMAMANNSAYMVTFNLENAPGSSGKVINNRSGGHWCRIVRSGRCQIGSNSIWSDIPPLIAGVTHAGHTDFAWCSWTTAGGTTVSEWGTCPEGLDSGSNNRNGQGFRLYPTFPHVVEEIRNCYVSERVTLPAGRARFLALGDSDEGPRITSRKWSCGYGTTYPRPYFGYMDPSNRLYPWGGYDPTLPSVTPWANTTPPDPAFPPPGPFSTYSGLFYQGKDEPRLDSRGCRNPADRKFDVDWNRDGIIAGSDAECGPEKDYYLLREDQPRPLINGDWGDFTILFNQDGTAVFPAMKCNRRWYANSAGANGCGASDLAKYWSVDRTAAYNSYTLKTTVPNGESIHYQRHTDRAFITIAPDSPDDRDQFASPNEALRTLLPMCRVFVTTAGYVGITPVRWNENVLTELPAQDPANPNPWPSDPAIFSMATAAHRDWMAANFRYGWPNVSASDSNSGSTDGTYWGVVPLGKPITDQVSTAMMTRRIWWMVP